jgi:hypothetical protein
MYRYIKTSLNEGRGGFDVPIHLLEKGWVVLVVDVLHKILAVNAVHGSVRQRDSSAEVVADTPTGAAANLVNNREVQLLSAARHTTLF